MITNAILHEALAREIWYLNDELTLKNESEWRGRLSYRAYAVLTLCRILYTGATGSVASKAQAAKWALKHAPRRFHGLIRDAVEVSNDAGSATLAIDWIADLIRHVREQVEGRALEGGDPPGRPRPT